MAAPVIGRRKRWMPPPHARIDWSHPLAQGLIAYVIPHGNASRDLVKGITCTVSGTAPSLAITPMGHGMTANGGRYRFGTTPYNLPTAGLVSVAAFIQRPSAGGLLRVINRWGAAGTDQQWLLYVDGSGNPVLIISNVTSTTTLTSSGAAITAGDFSFIGASHSGTSFGNQNMIMKDGNRIAVASAGRDVVTSSASSLCLGNSEDSTESGGIHGVSMVWGRYVSEIEHAQLYADPFQMLVW